MAVRMPSKCIRRQALFIISLALKTYYPLLYGEMYLQIMLLRPGEIIDEIAL